MLNIPDAKSLDGLTWTEMEILKLHLRGLAPRSIASELKVSVKTVYKALSKWRHIMEGAQDTSQEWRCAGLNAHKGYDLAFKSAENGISELTSEIRELRRVLEDLITYVRKLSDVCGLTIESYKNVMHVDAGAYHAPSFIKDNPWIEILRMRGRG